MRGSAGGDQDECEARDEAAAADGDAIRGGGHGGGDGSLRAGKRLPAAPPVRLLSPGWVESLWVESLQLARQPVLATHCVVKT